MFSRVDASKIVGASPSPVTVWDSSALRKFRHNPQAMGLAHAIDELGRGSCAAQGLRNVLTSVERLHDNPSQRLYLLAKGKDFIGILKMGPKKLFIRTKTGDLKEIDPLCVLDFYVCESEQRSGFGRVLFDTMLEREGVQPHQLGYDRPSPKFLAFLRKHFGLSDYVPQTNNFVVFEQYFARNAPQLAPRPAVPSAVGMPRADEQRSLSATAPTPYSSAPVPIPLNRPPAVGLSQKPGRIPVSAAALAASLPPQPAHGGASLSRSLRTTSPTRSGAGYNIITCADEPTAASPPQPMARGRAR